MGGSAPPQQPSQLTKSPPTKRTRKAKKERMTEIRPVNFTPSQAVAIDKAVGVLGTHFATYVREAALQRLHRDGFWDPVACPGPVDPEESDS